MRYTLFIFLVMCGCSLHVDVSFSTPSARRPAPAPVTAEGRDGWVVQETETHISYYVNGKFTGQALVLEENDWTVTRTFTDQAGQEKWALIREYNPSLNKTRKCKAPCERVK